MNLAIRPHEAGTAVIEPLDWLDADQYALFREVCERSRAKYNGTVFVLKREKVQTAREAGESLGFGVVVDAEVVPASAPTRVLIGTEPRDDSTWSRTILDSSCKDWTPFHYQVEDIEWMAPREHAGLFSEPGTGKTIVALMAIPRDARVLLVVPGAIKHQWRDEVLLRRPDYRVTILNGRKSFRWPEVGEAVITSYEILPGSIQKIGASGQVLKYRRIDKSSIPQSPGDVVLIGDEIHKIRNDQTIQHKRWQALRKAIKPGPNRRVWGMTGTELLNQPQEFWNLLCGLNLEVTAFGDWPRFVAAFGGAENRSVAIPGFGKYKWPPVEEMVKHMSPDLTARIQSVSRKRLLRDVQSQLPAKTIQWKDVELDKATIIQCDKAMELLRERGIDLANIQQTIDLTKLHGVAFNMMSLTRAALATAKLGAAIELVKDAEDAGEPLIVSCAHRIPVDAIASRPGWAHITGDESSLKRRQIVQAFERGEYKGIAGTIAAMGVGLDGMQRRAWRILEIDLDWVPDMNRQLEARLCRIGQSRGVMVMRLRGNHPLDWRVLERIAEKVMLIEASTEGAALRWNGAAA